MFILIFMLSGCIQGINESVQQIQEQERMLIPQESKEISGDQLFVNKGCLACHEYNTLSCPNLDGLSKRGTFLNGTQKVNEENLSKWLRNPAAMKPGTSMPNLGLSEQEINKLVEYLLSK